jgi:hypothetical protein
MKRFTTILMVSMAILFILVPVTFAGSGSPEKPEGATPRGLAIQGDAPGEKLVGVVAMEHYGFYECGNANCANVRATVRLRKSTQLRTFFAYVNDVVLGDFRGQQEQLMQAMKADILSAFGMDPNAQIVVRSLEEFGSADDFNSPLAEISGGPIFNYVMDIVLAVK